MIHILQNHDLSLERRKLLFRSRHRGMLEMDYLLGAFAEKYLPYLTKDEMTEYEKLLDIPDDVLFSLFFEGDGENCESSLAKKIFTFVHSFKSAVICFLFLLLT